MHEYEFRLVVQHTSSFLPFLQSLGLPLATQVVYYVKPHFRFRHRTFETKRLVSAHAVYHDGQWFRWVHSLETPYRRWSRATCQIFLHAVGNFQDPFKRETRSVLTLDAHAQLYTFQRGIRCHRLVFEWEYGTFSRALGPLDLSPLLESLNRYRDFYRRLSPFAIPPFQLIEEWTRRPVTNVESVPRGPEMLYASKLDGTFGLVYSYRDHLKETWEGYACIVRPQVTLGDGLVLAAERMPNGNVYLLDVYQVRGLETLCRRALLTEFLPGLALPEGYHVQTYVSEPATLNPDPRCPTDGVVIHDMVRDVIYKYKTQHSLDLVYYQGYFYTPNGRIQCLEKEGMEDGCVYEISTQTGCVLRPRRDRFKGNTAAQLENVLKHGWHGPRIEPLPPPPTKRKKK